MGSWRATNRPVVQYLDSRDVSSGFATSRVIRCWQDHYQSNFLYSKSVDDFVQQVVYDLFLL